MTVKPPGLIRSPSRGIGLLKSEGSISMIKFLKSMMYLSRNSLSVSMLEQSKILRLIFLSSRMNISVGASSSILFMAITNGIFFFFKMSDNSSSNFVHIPASQIITAISALSNIFLDLSIRCADKVETSSNPAVSRKFTGPIGRSSIDFSTTSVVVPGTAEVIATSCPAIIFRKLDFPTFVLPKIPI